jgi:hypothetical protein
VKRMCADFERGITDLGFISFTSAGGIQKFTAAGYEIELKLPAASCGECALCFGSLRIVAVEGISTPRPLVSDWHYPQNVVRLWETYRVSC